MRAFDPKKRHFDPKMRKLGCKVQKCKGLAPPKGEVRP